MPLLSTHTHNAFEIASFNVNMMITFLLIFSPNFSHKQPFLILLLIPLMCIKSLVLYARLRSPIRHSRCSWGWGLRWFGSKPNEVCDWFLPFIVSDLKFWCSIENFIVNARFGIKQGEESAKRNVLLVHILLIATFATQLR